MDADDVIGIVAEIAIQTGIEEAFYSLVNAGQPEIRPSLQEEMGDPPSKSK